jgi:hypothetical protein
VVEVNPVQVNVGGQVVGDDAGGYDLRININELEVVGANGKK